MRQFTRCSLAAALCTALACGEGDPESVPTWTPDSGAPAATPDASTASPDAGGGTMGGATSDAAARDGEAEAADTDAAAPEAGSAGDAGRADAGGGDAGLPEPGDGGSADASPGPDEVLHATIIVEPGETFDGQGRRFSAGPELGDGSQSESQKPLFRLEDGARLTNVVLGSPAADGVHTYGDVTLENIVWEDIGEDALTIKESGTVILNGGSARDGSDKIFQINAASTFRVSNFTARRAGKFIRQNGGTTFKVDVFIDGCDIAEMDEAIFRTDSSASTVSMTNTRYSAIGETLFKGVNPANITTANNTAY